MTTYPDLCFEEKIKLQVTCQLYVALLFTYLGYSEWSDAYQIIHSHVGTFVGATMNVNNLTAFHLNAHG